MSKIPGTTYIKEPSVVTPAEENELRDLVAGIIRDVATRGDAALREYNKKFDKFDQEAIEVTAEEIEASRKQCDDKLLEDMKFGIERVTQFAKAQLETMKDLEVETIPGLHLGHRLIPIQRAGCYVPGGRYPLLSSAQMTVIPAKVAGVKEIIVCTPPNVHPAVLYAAHLSGATKIFKVGGAQAIAALAYGTESIPRVDKIVGPGNKFVNEAKRQVFGLVGIDQLAGPSEIGILADETADPKVLAADLLGQAEHDVEARAILMTTSREIGEATLREMDRQLSILATREVAEPAWRKHGGIVLCDSEESMIAYSDEFAAEHLQIHTKNAKELARRLTNYGSLFIGESASVVFSDKIAGTNHTLPTRGAGRYTGGLWVGSFIKTVTHQWVEKKAVDVIAPICVRQSHREALDAHRIAAEIRYNYDVV
ncbi:histidinol dehydrogenase [Burkholderia anthina]|uniref:histidinol dehydrogenase n=1 Tax=Burkholderia anthina TaxID=179879 RepID=UPI001588D028|nr:histidinol dehydrogenase [Burkholderia anthina]